MQTRRKAPPRPRRDPSYIDPILELQRLAGNAAVTDLISSARTQERNTVQRDEAATAQHAPATDAPAKKALKVALDQYKLAWPFLASKQVSAVNEIKEEAKKPHKPTLAEELLKVAAEAALAGVLSGLGELLKDKIQEKIEEAMVEAARDAATGRFRGAGGKFVTEAAGIEAAKAAAKAKALFAGEAAKEIFANSAEKLIAGKVLEQLTEKRNPLDAFFQGQADALTDAGHDGQNEAISQVADIEEQPLDIALPTALVLHKSMEAMYAEAARRQKDQTLREWFIYEAQADRNSPKRQTNGTDLGSASDGWGVFDSPGVLYLTVRPGTSEIKGAKIKGTTEHMIALIENKPIKDLKLPIIISMTSLDGDDFSVRLNENGVMWIVPEGGGAGRQLFMGKGGGKLMMGEYGNWYQGGDAEVERGARRLVEQEVGSQTLKGLLSADQGD